MNIGEKGSKTLLMSTQCWGKKSRKALIRKAALFRYYNKSVHLSHYTVKRQRKHFLESILGGMLITKTKRSTYSHSSDITSFKPRCRNLHNFNKNLLGKVKNKLLVVAIQETSSHAGCKLRVGTIATLCFVSANVQSHYVHEKQVKINRSHNARNM